MFQFVFLFGWNFFSSSIRRFYTIFSSFTWLQAQWNAIILWFLWLNWLNFTFSSLFRRFMIFFLVISYYFGLILLYFIAKFRARNRHLIYVLALLSETVCKVTFIYQHRERVKDRSVEWSVSEYALFKWFGLMWLLFACVNGLRRCATSPFFF